MPSAPIVPKSGGSASLLRLGASQICVGLTYTTVPVATIETVGAIAAEDTAAGVVCQAIVSAPCGKTTTASSIGMISRKGTLKRPKKVPQHHARPARP